MYWRDIDTIAPRRPVRAHQNHRKQPTTKNIKFRKPNMVNEPLVEETPLPGEVLEQEIAPAKDEVIAKQSDQSGIHHPDEYQPDWQETAQRLQAEMDNFRKRQERRADESIARERERLFSLFLPAVDNLTRALAHQDSETEEGVRQGVELTRRELMRVLEAEGIMPIETTGQLFDPAWHEAVATISADVEPGTIVEQVETGYKLGDKLLRPAKVVVAA